MIDIKKLRSVIQKNAAIALAELDGFRKELQEINDELEWLENSPFPLADTVENIRDFIKLKAGTCSVEHFFYKRDIAGLKPLNAKTELNQGSRVSGHSIIGGRGVADITEMMCSLLGPSIEASFIAIAEEMAKTIKSGPPLADREQIKKDLQVKKYEIEVAEEILISEAEELGLIGFYRRQDCNPEIVLMMDDDSAYA